jgi:hypothetical protein
MHLANRIAICITFAAATLTANAQQQQLTCTVSDCWQLAGRNETTFFDIVQQLAEISAQTRGLTLPDNAEAGRSTGEYIKAKAHTDHGQLLYAIVDAAIRKVGKPAATN